MRQACHPCDACAESRGALFESAHSSPPASESASRWTDDVLSERAVSAEPAVAMVLPVPSGGLEGERLDDLEWQGSPRLASSES
mmetsp:Transcript_32642/g.81174  ORF Transcript_32642/g.81174 Transcript_32642/m.81174 type:complete len:84 (+) Transcript_32642:58-309(+)